MIGTLSADFIMARGHKRRTLEAGHMTAPARIANFTRFPLHRSGRPHMTHIQARQATAR